MQPASQHKQNVDKRKEKRKTKVESDQEWLERAREECRIASNTNSDVPIVLHLSLPKDSTVVNILNKELKEPGWRMYYMMPYDDNDNGMWCLTYKYL